MGSGGNEGLPAHNSSAPRVHKCFASVIMLRILSNVKSCCDMSPIRLSIEVFLSSMGKLYTTWTAWMIVILTDRVIASGFLVADIYCTYFAINYFALVWVTNSCVGYSISSLGYLLSFRSPSLLMGSYFSMEASKPFSSSTNIVLALVGWRSHPSNSGSVCRIMDVRK